VELKLEQNQLLIIGLTEEVKKARNFFHSSFLLKLGYDKVEISEKGQEQSWHLRFLKLSGYVLLCYVIMFCCVSLKFFDINYFACILISL